MPTKTLKLINALALVFALVMNTLANALPLGGKDTGELSALYPNLFVPAGFTFAIWGLIYLLLIIFVIWQWAGDSEDVVRKIGPWFAVNTIANGTWIAVWHGQLVWLSIVVMLVLLFSLMKMYSILKISYPSIDVAWKVPISVYLGWISVATIANFTTVLVDNGIVGLGLGAANWAAVMLAIAIILALYLVSSRRDVFFAAVVTWASFGIYSKRVADIGTTDQIVEYTAMGGMAILTLAILWGLVQLVKK